jgi:hypothetical protein
MFSADDLTEIGHLVDRDETSLTVQALGAQALAPDVALKDCPFRELRSNAIRWSNSVLWEASFVLVHA